MSPLGQERKSSAAKCLYGSERLVILSHESIANEDRRPDSAGRVKIWQRANALVWSPHEEYAASGRGWAVAVESVVNGSAGPGVRTAARDAGLVRVIGPVGLTAAIVNSVVGSGVFLLPGAIAAGAGRFGPLAFLACAVAMGPVVVCFAEGGRLMPTSGGPYAYIEAAFGRLAGFIAASLLLVGCV